MQKVAKGQITLVSLADGSSTIFYVTPNLSTQQIYLEDAGTYTPNYQNTPLTLTPHLKVGRDTIQNAEYAWYKGGSAQALTGVSASGVLTINTNVASAQEVYRCVATFVDPSSGSTCTTETQVVLSKITSGGSIVTTFLEPALSAEDGVTDKRNYIDQDNDAVAYDATVYYGSAIKDNSDSDSAIVYEWSIFDSVKNNFVGFKQSSAIQQGATQQNNASALAGTVYFKKNQNRDVSNVSSYDFIDGSSSDWDIKIYNNLIVLKRDAIDAKETIRCEASYYDKSGSTRGTFHGADADIETVRDLTDPYQCTITSTSMAFTSNVEVAKLTAHLIQNGQDITNNIQDLSFDWDAYSLNSVSGELDVPWEEYTKSGNVYTKIPAGSVETGTGYWVYGGDTIVEGGTKTITSPTYSQSTDEREVTVIRQLVGPASNVECTLRW